MIICIDIIESRLEIAKKGYSEILTINLYQQDLLAVINEATGGRGVDIVFEVVGHSRTISG